jgi:hypothetical protein
MLVNQKKNKRKETTSNLADKNTNLSQIQEEDTNVDEDIELGTNIRIDTSNWQ